MCHAICQLGSVVVTNSGVKEAVSKLHVRAKTVEIRVMWGGGLRPIYLRVWMWTSFVKLLADK